MMHSDSEFTFLELCSLLQEIEDQRYRGDKITLLSVALALPLSDNELLLMVQFTGEGAFPDISGKRRSEEHTSELQSRGHLVCRLLLEKKKRPLDRTEFTSTQH